MIHRAPATYKRGFTLIETIIYIGLSGLVLGGIMSAAYPMFTSTERIVANVTAEGEAAFILHKISHILTQSISPTPIQAPPGSGTSATSMTVNTFGGAVTISQSGNDILLGTTPLNASRVTISNFSVKHFNPVVNGLPRYVEISFNANGKLFGPIRKYLHF